MKLKFKKILLCVLSAMTLIPATGNVRAVFAPPTVYHRPTMDLRALGAAIRDGNLPYVINFFQNSRLGINDVTNVDGEGQTPLQHAACFGQLQIVDWLVSHGADIDAANEYDYGLNPLTYAAMNGHWDVVRYLVLHRADVNAMTDEDPDAEVGFTALTCASSDGNLDMVNFLLFHGADVNIDFEYTYSALEGATAYNHLNVVKHLIESAHARGNIDNLIQLAQERNATEVANYLRRSQRSRLVNAIIQNNLNEVRYLIECDHIDVRPAIDRLIQIAQEVNAIETANYLRQL